MDKYRPTAWDGYIGQRKVKDRLSIAIQGARSRDEKMEHVLLTGPAGCGKTTLAQIIADEVCLPFRSYVMPIKPVVMQRIMFEEFTVVFLDEIHRMSKRQQEEFLTILEDGYWQMDNGMVIENDHITFIGATTELDQMIKPLVDRFTLKPKFEDYTDAQMARIIVQMSEKVGHSMSFELANQLGRATGGVPRNAKAIVGMARNLESNDASLILEKCGLTADGFSEDHLEYLQVLQGNGTLAGIETITSHMQQNKSTVIDLERLLVKRGAVLLTKSGRQLTSKGYKILKENT